MLLRTVELPARPEAAPAVATARPASEAQRAIALETLLVLGLIVLAVALRLPNLQTIPAFNDETEDILRGWLITQGKLLPLVDDVSNYDGSLWNWLLAGTLWISGFNLYAPRMLIMALGALTVLASYFLGRAWAGRDAGLLTAALLGTSAVHIVVNSHVAWGNCITPLFTTVAIWMLWSAVQSGVGESARPARLALSGLCWGLAFQTHPSVLALLPGAALFVVWKGRALLRTRWPYVAAVLFVLVNLNIIVYNLLSGFSSVSVAMGQSDFYTDYTGLTLPTYLFRLTRLGLGLLQNIGGALDLRETDLSYLVDPALWVSLLLAVAGAIWQWRRGNPLPVLLLVGVVLMLPLFNSKYRPVLNGRYLMPLLPVFYAGISALLVAGFNRLRRGELTGRHHPGAVHWLGQLGLTLLMGFIVIHPLVYVQTYYDQETRISRTNMRSLQMLGLITSSRRPGETVVLDQLLETRALGPGAGRLGSVFRLGLTLRNVPYRLTDPSTDDLLAPGARCESQLLLLAARDPDLDQQLVGRLDLRAVDRGPAVPAVPLIRYGAYRLFRLDPQPSGC